MERGRTPNSLKKYRRMVGLSQREVAQFLDMKDTSRISRWEKGLSHPDLYSLFLLSLLYKTHPFHLYMDVWQSLKPVADEREQTLLAAIDPLPTDETFYL